MNNLIKERDQNIAELRNAIGAIQHEKDLMSKKLHEIEINNNDLTVRSSQK